MPGPTLPAVPRSASIERLPAFAKLQIAGDEINAVVDAQAGQNRAERAAEDVQMADDQRGVAQRANQPDQQRPHRHQRMADAAETGDEHQKHAQEREHGRHADRRLAALHLVVFQDRQAGQADLDRGILPLNAADDAAQRGDRLRCFG